jgi:hypothetical protein
MDSDSDEEKYYASDTGDKEEPRQPSRRYSISQLPSPDFSASSSEYEDVVGNVMYGKRGTSLLLVCV